jgi:hypothetical protein
MRVRAARECKASGRVFENYKQVRFRANLSCFVVRAPERGCITRRPLSISENDAKRIVSQN